VTGVLVVALVCIVGRDVRVLRRHVIHRMLRVVRGVLAMTVVA
jgi:hypothetical protein